MPLISSLARRVQGWLGRVVFPGSISYWELRYAAGKTSGPGSYGRLAEFKAEFANSFVNRHNIRSVIEFGCGDGNQLSLAAYPSYIGLDVSRTAIKLCKERFSQDETKSFFLYEPDCFVDRHSVFRADLALSLDVVYHLVEDQIFEHYMRHLFAAAEKFVIIYSSDTDQKGKMPHVKHRQFSRWVERNLPEWRLAERVPNKYPFASCSGTESFASFLVYEKSG